MWHGFVRATDGTITTFDAPNSTSTYANGINDSGGIVGWYNNSGKYGFIRTTNGTITTIDLDGSNDVAAYAINRYGVVAGSMHAGYGFVRAADGTIRKFHPKKSLGVSNIGGINGKGVIAGSLLDNDGLTYHGFVRTP